MAAKIVEMHTEILPALRLIGKQCDCEMHTFIEDWNEWFENGWFDQLEKLGAAPENRGLYLGVTDNSGGYWIGLLFPPDMLAPNGFTYADIPAARFAVSRFDGKKGQRVAWGGRYKSCLRGSAQTWFETDPSLERLVYRAVQSPPHSGRKG